MDEAGFSLIPSVQRTWSPRGVTPIIRHRFSKKRLHAVVAIVTKPDGGDCDVLFYMQPQEINSWSTMAFLDALHQEIPDNIVLLFDNLSSHRSKIVKDHIYRHREWLTVEYFPAYAPELNPAEYMLSALKSKDVANFCADTLEQIADKLEDAAGRIGNQANIIHGFLKASTLFDEQELVTVS